ncbi:MAG: hypothetical protein AB7P01_08055 [Bacteroidia bacterium]
MFYLLFNGMFVYDNFSGLPKEFLTYPSIATLYGEFPSQLYFAAIDIAVFFCVFLVMIGLFTRVASVLTFILIVLNYSFAFSIGGASSLLIIPFFFLVLAFSNWTFSYSLDALLFKKKKPTNTAFIVIILLATLTFSFFISAFMKIKGGWLSCDSQAIFVYWFSNYFIDSRVSVLNPDNFYINSKLFWEASDYIIVLVEAAPFLLLWNKKLLRVSFLFLGAFQLLVYIFLNISFSVFPIMYCFFIIDTEKSVLYKGSITFFDKLFQQKNILKMVIAVSLLFFIYVYFYFFGNRTGWNKDFPLVQLLGLWVSFGLYVYLFIESLVISRKVSS